MTETLSLVTEDNRDEAIAPDKTQAPVSRFGRDWPTPILMFTG
jgi:hypothetical protein